MVISLPLRSVFAALSWTTPLATPGHGHKKMELAPPMYAICRLHRAAMHRQNQKWGNAMRKCSLMLLLATVSSSAAAQWGKWFLVDQSQTFVIYAHIATIRKAGNMAQMWDLSDAKTGQTLGGVRQSRSFTIEREYDCSKQQVRVLYVAWYPEQMGEGKIVGSESNPGNWQPALLGTIGERLWKIACGVENRRHF
jgi:hypothetical protein